MSTRIHNPPRLVRGAAQEAAWRDALPPATEHWRRELGEPITDHRSSWVRRLATARGTVFLKTYEYLSWDTRLRNFARWTRPGAASRAAREFDALQWMARQGLPAPEPLTVHEWRHFGFLQRATLVTTAFPGSPVSALLPTLPTDARTQLARAIGRLVGQLHLLGFRDRNLDLRNLIAQPHGDTWLVAKIDSPRYRLRARGSHDALCEADWTRLSSQLQPYDLDTVARLAAARSATDGTAPTTIRNPQANAGRPGSEPGPRRGQSPPR